MKKLLWAILCWSLTLSFANAAEIRMPPQALSASLQELAKQSGIQIVFFSKLVEGHNAPALNGTFTPEAAVAALLKGTDLTYHRLNDRTIEIAANPVIARVWPVTPEEPVAPLDQVEITATRENLSVMRAEIQTLEEKFYAEYNKLTPDPQYHIHCTMEPQKDARVMSRVCQPAFVASASGDEAAVVAREKTPDYQKNMVALVEKHPELLQLVKERNALAQRYEALRNQMLNQPKTVRKFLAAERRVASASNPKGYQRVELNGKEYFCRPPAEVTSQSTRQTCLTRAQLRALQYANAPQPVEGFGSPGVAITPNAPYIPVQVPYPY
jgi:hypothetical protein